MLCEQGNIVAPFPKRWKMHLHHVQAIKKIFAEFSLLNHLRKIPVRRADQPDVYGDRRLLPSRSKLRSCSARSNLGCSPSPRSPISSRNRVPWSANSTRPRRHAMAPVKAPFSCPKSSSSISVSGKSRTKMQPVDESRVRSSDESRGPEVLSRCRSRQ